MEHLTRRTFLRNTTATLAVTLSATETLLNSALADSPLPLAPAQGETKNGDMLYRTLGRTGEKVSVIGLGGFDIGKQQNEEESIRIIRTAIDKGITFMDNCWDYHDGTSEIRMGKALLDGYRDKVFLMTKIDARTKTVAAQQIDECLERLQTDYIDLLQHHEILRMEDPDQVFALGGAMEAVVDAKKAGKVRYIGFTGHKDPLVHLRMLEVAAQHDFRFDTAMMPLNVMDGHFRSFGRQVLPVLIKEQIGILSMKPMGGGYILKSNTVTPIECLHYAMSLPTSVVITGMDALPLVDQACEAARTFKPLDQQQIDALLAKTSAAAAKGEFELYKTTAHFDGTARKPEWLGYPKQEGV